MSNDWLYYCKFLKGICGRHQLVSGNLTSSPSLPSPISCHRLCTKLVMGGGVRGQQGSQGREGRVSQGQHLEGNEDLCSALQGRSSCGRTIWKLRLDTSWTIVCVLMLTNMIRCSFNFYNSDYSEGVNKGRINWALKLILNLSSFGKHTCMCFIYCYFSYIYPRFRWK